MGDLLRPRFGAGPSHLERKRLWRLIWMTCPGIGAKRLQCLHEARAGGLEQAWSAAPEDLQAALASARRLGPSELKAFLAYRERIGAEPLSHPITTEERERWSRRRQLLPGDRAMPTAIANLEQPPLQLLWRGKGSLWAALRERQAVAVMGTRQPSRHGMEMARRIGRALAQAGWPVLNGLAEGIDAAAHQGCLEAGGAPIGVIGTPLTSASPRHQRSLQEEVARQGLLISEWAEGTAVKPAHFSLRKRLILALANAVVLVEFPEGSSSQRDAQRAWEKEIPLWVVPGDAGRPAAAGSNQWLQRGATALINTETLIEALGPGPLKRVQAAAASRIEQRLAGREALLLAALGAGASLDELCRRLRSQPQLLSRRLLQLELAGLICSEPGLWWRPSAGASL